VCAGTARAPRWRATRRLVTPSRPPASAENPALPCLRADRCRRGRDHDPWPDRRSHDQGLPCRRSPERAATAGRASRDAPRQASRRTCPSPSPARTSSWPSDARQPRHQAPSPSSHHHVRPTQPDPPPRPPERIRDCLPASTHRGSAASPPGPAGRRATTPTAATAHPASYWPQPPDTPSPAPRRPNASDAADTRAGRSRRRTLAEPSPPGLAAPVAPATAAACRQREAVSGAGSQKPSRPTTVREPASAHHPRIAPIKAFVPPDSCVHARTMAHRVSRVRGSRAGRGGGGRGVRSRRVPAVLHRPTCRRDRRAPSRGSACRGTADRSHHSPS